MSQLQIYRKFIDKNGVESALEPALTDFFPSIKRARWKREPSPIYSEANPCPEVSVESDWDVSTYSYVETQTLVVHVYREE